MIPSLGSLHLDNVSVKLADREVVKNATLKLEPGRFVALAGPNGAGKTTLLRAIAGLSPVAGNINVGGTNLNALSRQERAKQMAYLPQGHQVHWPLTVRDVVALGRYPHGLSDPSQLSVDHARAIDTAMSRTQTLPFADRRIMNLSGGERARVMLARVLAVEAPILLADEPTSSLDPRHQILVMNDLKAESRRGALVVVVTHDIWLASRLADEIVLINEGCIVAHGHPSEVLTDERLAEVYGVTALRQSINGEAMIAPWGLA
jgi:iron complex transport system ATP-binding protein